MHSSKRSLLDTDRRRLAADERATVAAIRLLDHLRAFAAEAHDRLVSIQPFIDGNGRTARLLMNLALLQHSYVITIIPPILRSDHLVALKKAQTGESDDFPFINFISNMVCESQKDYLRLLRGLREG